MRKIPTGSVLLLVILLLAAAPAIMAGKKNPREAFYGVTPKMNSAGLDGIRQALLRIESECPKTQQKCAAVKNFYRAAFGDLNLDNLPILVVYVDESGDVRVNRLLWRNHVTPYVHGVQNVWLAVFSEKQVDLNAELSILWAKRGSMAAGLRDVFVPSGRRTREDREAQDLTEPIPMFELSARAVEVEDELWLGSHRFYVEPNTAYRVVMRPADEKSYEMVNFEESHARFTSSKRQSVGVGLGLGYTGDISDEEVPPEEDVSGIRTSSGVLGAYWTVSVYVKRPLLVKPIGRKQGSRYSTSYAVTFGVNLNIFELDQFVLGVNIGHLFGRHGMIVGVNFIDPFSSTEDPPTAKPFVAVNFLF